MTRIRPAKLIWPAVALALLAVACVALLPRFIGPQPIQSGAILPPDWAGSIASLSREGVYDTDADGLADSLENLVYGTNPNKLDSGGAGIPDGWLVKYGYDPLTPGIASTLAISPPADALSPAYGNAWPAKFLPTLRDVYQYGRPSDWNESRQGPYQSRLDPTRWDANGDTIADGWSMRYGLDPLNSSLGPQRLAGPASLTVMEAFRHNTNPWQLDSDQDGLTDRQEVDGPSDLAGHSLPPTDPARFDSSGTGVCDGYLVAHGFDANLPASSLTDQDSDGATTQEEYKWSEQRFGGEACGGRGSDPAKPFTGPSKIPDGWLIRFGLDLLDGGTDGRVTQSADKDPGPGQGPAAETRSVDLTTWLEYAYDRPSTWNEAATGPWWGGTDPTQEDTDGDGLGDAWEQRGFSLSVATRPGMARETHPTHSDPTKKDTDGDGLNDFDEASGPLATDPRRRDTDFDGINDGEELALGLGLDATLADTAEDLLTDGARLRILTMRAQAYALDDTYEHPGKPGLVRHAADWAAAFAGASTMAKPLRGQDLARLLGPAGDANGNGIPNVREKDIDEDGLLNGLEALPLNYARSQFGIGDFPEGRPASDPLNPDTDGDRLPDGWEVQHGVPGALRYNLDPSQWNSDAETETVAGTSDADEDPDGDSMTWFTFEGDAAVPHDFAFTNLEEYVARTDPNEPSSDDDGLSDGWKVFWESKYRMAGDWGDVYPGAPGPLDLPPPIVQVGTPQGSTVLIHPPPYTRVALRDAQRLPGETAASVSIPDPTGPSGPERVVDVLTGTRAWTLLDAQRTKTNPYLEDTDGDGMPDWWEDFHRTALPGRDGSAPTEAECPGTGPSPVAVDGQTDSDQDGLVNRLEFAVPSDPVCIDSDLAGLGDGEEADFGLDAANPLDDQFILGNEADTDGDGLLDFEELTGIRSVDYSDLAPRVRTNHLLADSDGDGLLDGEVVPNPDTTPDGWPATHARAGLFLDLGIAYSKTPQGNFFFLGEHTYSTDPRDGDDAGTGVPAGWLVAHSQKLHDTDPERQARLLARYEFIMPAWWDQQRHGPWWGGARPGEDLEALQSNLDLDEDGLRDRDGPDGYEDPLPTSTSNRPEPVPYGAYGIDLPADAHPANATLDATAARLLAQSMLSPRALGSTYGRDFQAAPIERTQACIALDSGMQGRDVVKGVSFPVTGRVSACSNPARGLPLVTVEVRGGEPSQAYGLAVAEPDGRFAVAVNITVDHAMELPSPALVVRGNTSGVVRWTTDPARMAPGAVTLDVRSYSTPGEAPYAERLEPVRSTTVPLDLRLGSGSRLTLDVPSTVPTGQDFTVRVELKDSAGSPLSHPVRLAWMEDTYNVQVFNGAGQRTLPASHSMAGDHALAAVSLPPPGSQVEAGVASKAIRLQRPVDITLAVPSTADAGEPLVLEGRLDSPGGDVAGVPVSILLAKAGQALPAVATATAGASGSFTARLDLPATASKGDYIVTARTPATASTLPGLGQEPLSLRSIPRFVDVDASDLVVGEKVRVAARLVEPDGSEPLANAPIELDLGDVKAHSATDSHGRLEIVLDAQLPRRPLLQTLSFSGDGTHVAATSTLERAVTSASRLTLGAGTIAIGSAARVLVALEDAQGAPVAGAPVNLTWGTDPVRTLITSSNGIVFLVRQVDAGDLGPVLVRAQYQGSVQGGLSGSSATAPWVVRSPAELVLPNGTFQPGSEIPQGLLRDSSGNPLARQEVLLDIQGAPRQALTTDDLGRFVALPSPGPNEGARLVEVSAIYRGDGIYAPTENRSTIDQRAPVNLTLRAPPIVVAGRGVAILANVVDSRGAAVLTGELTASLGKQRMGPWTLEGGQARLEVTVLPETPVGPMRLLVQYEGDRSHATATAEVLLTVVGKAQMDIQGERVPVGGIASVRVTVAVGDAPIPFTPIFLTLSGNAGGLVGMTDRDGVATFQVEQADHDVVLAARFAGSEQLSPAFASALLEPASPLRPGAAALSVGMVLAGLSFLLLSSAAIALRLRKQPLEGALRRVHLLLAARGTNERTILAAYRILEDTAIGNALLVRPAATARELEAALAQALPARAHANLSSFIGIFEDARYGILPLSDSARRTALDELQHLLGLIRDDQGGLA